MPKILITRPLETAALLAETLKQRGYTPLIEPLLTITPHAAPRPNYAHAQAIMLTSSNALLMLEPRRKETTDLIGLPCFCVGPKTAANATAFGFTDVRHTNNDGAALAQMIEQSLPPRTTIIHPTGVGISSVAVQTLIAKDYTVLSWAVYRTEAASRLSPELQEALKTGALSAALFFSPKTAALFAKGVAQCQLTTCCSHSIAIGLSQVVAARLQLLNWQQVLTATEPSESAMIECLVQHCPVN